MGTRALALGVHSAEIADAGVVVLWFTVWVMAVVHDAWFRRGSA
jgi:hypothetical protein